MDSLSSCFLETCGTVNRNLRLQGVGQLKGVGVLGDYTANIFSALKVFNLSVVELGKTN